MEDFKPVMKTGVPELSLPPMEPLAVREKFNQSEAFILTSDQSQVDHIELKLFEAIVEFNDVMFSGFQNMIVQSSKVDSSKKTWSVKLRLPKMSASSNYALYGSIPPNLDLERSEGPGRLKRDYRKKILI